LIQKDLLNNEYSDDVKKINSIHKSTAKQTSGCSYFQITCKTDVNWNTPHQSKKAINLIIWPVN